MLSKSNNGTVLYMDDTMDSRKAESLLKRNSIEFSVTVLDGMGDYPRPYLTSSSHNSYFGLGQIRLFVDQFNSFQKKSGAR